MPPAEATRPVTPAIADGRAIVPLSAKTPEQLEQKARELLAFVRRDAASLDLHELSYTLQIGRDPMDERLGIVAGSTAELAAKLESWLEGTARVEGVHRGKVTRTTESTSILNQDEDVRKAIVQKWIAEQKLGRLAELWVHGLDVEWDELHGEIKPRRIALPVYPFARERYWIEADASVAAVAATKLLHPLVHSNTSDFSEQRYSSTFGGDEFFLADHRVRTDGGQVNKLLPGVAYLEMARAAIGQAAPSQSDESVLELRDTVWLKPVVVSSASEVSIALVAGEEGNIEYEVYSGHGEHETVHCQGQAVFGRRTEPRRVELEPLRQQMRRRTLTASEVYSICNTMGLHYGPAHQGITRLYVGDGELVADLRLPAVIDGNRHDYVLHPSLLDSALQATIGLIVDPRNVPATPYVPFAVESVRVLDSCTREMTAWVRYANGRKADETAKVDIDLCDAQGNVCVELRGFALRVLDGEGKAVTAPSATVERLPIKPNGNGHGHGNGNGNGNGHHFDEDFYELLIKDIENHKLSIDEALEMS